MNITYYMRILTSISIQTLFTLHLILTSCSLFGSGSKIDSSYFFYNLIFISLLLGVILLPQENANIVALAQNINLLAIPLDIPQIIVKFNGYYRGNYRNGYYQSEYYGDEDFTKVTIIINLLLRVITTLVLNKIYKERTGNSSYPDIKKMMENIRTNLNERGNPPETANAFQEVVPTLSSSTTDDLKPPPYTSH